ncbi:MAG: hypothetical protein JSS98_07425 [Bacteroidetes bacterium]|nr:hypothetical protein [Bacteroidota bacterium]
MREKSYTAGITFAAGQIVALRFKVNKVMCTIENADNTAPEENMIEINDKDMYNEYHKADDEFYSKIIKESLLSDYPPSVIDVEEQYPMGPTTGFFDKFEQDKTYNAIDTVKAYSKCLEQINQVPVFGYFDEYQPYDDHEIEDLNMYCVEVQQSDLATTLLFPTKYFRCTGLRLKKAREAKIKFVIHAFRRPSRLEQVNFKGAVEKLFNNEKLSMEHKKFIANKTTGLTEKKYNSAHVCKAFDNFAEAQYYQFKFGGRIHSMEYFERVVVNNEDDPFNFGIENPLNTTTVVMKAGQKVHFLIVEKKEKLVEGFRCVKEMIYDHMAIRMFELFNEIVSKGLKPVGIKTDAILLTESRAKLDKLFKFNPGERGGIKFESGKFCTNHKVAQVVNTPFAIKKRDVNVIKIKDEYDTNEINKVFDQHGRVGIWGDFPGVGKTTSVLNYIGKKILFVTPFNTLAQETRSKGHDAITLNMLLGFFGEGKEYSRYKAFNVEEYDCICFDEIMMNPPHILKMIDVFMREKSDKKYFATGDTDQLQPFNSHATNISNPQQYLNHCVNSMFPNQLTLKINKRLKSDDDRKKLAQLKADVFNRKKNVMETLKQFGLKIITSMSDVKSKRNICYFNFRNQQVNTHVHKKLVKTPKNHVAITQVEGKKSKTTNYWKGLKLTCKKHWQQKGVRLFKNYTYEITFISQETFTVKDVVEDTTLTFPIAMLDHFILSYANTCHSVQGLSIDEPMTIFDINTPYVDRYFVWTALTRATDFNNVTIFKHSDDDVSNLTRSRVKQYFEKKVEGYKTQDKLADRTWKANTFVTAEWIKEEYAKLQQKQCACCKSPYEIYVDEDGTVKSNLTVDRIDSNLAHLKTNCRLLCRTCNSVKANRY